MSEALRIVSIGGGTGLSAVLNGLKRYAHPRFKGDAWLDITAVVTVTDDGGSSGRLRRDFDVLPPGDIRNCMVALAEDGAFLSRLFQYRFASGRGLKGHSFGNLFLTAMTHITGDFPDAVRQSAEVLNIAGRIFPATDSNVSLWAVLEDGRIVRGETRIGRSNARIKTLRLKPRGAKPLPETLDAIANADLITIGPGSLYTSLIPNLLVSGIPDAIRKSKALKACFMNLMSQPGETTDFTAEDHLAELLKHGGKGLLDCAVVNSSHFSARVRRRYAAQAAAPVEYDSAAIRAMGIELVEAQLVSEYPAGKERRLKARHDAAALANVAMMLAERGRARRRGASGAKPAGAPKTRIRQTGK
ncbi:MAG TPA: gluconeogenesis factor YvcK family protein [Bryobacteraceae bacterium]|jgi:uncharacterized cofD-like protein|nr:gluconeogenesis factor YvcK family protein [Bryobacteraceae bacterium]